MPTLKPHPKPITNADLAVKIDGLETKLSERLDKLESTVKESGLNGHSPLLKAFLEQYAATYTQRQAWLTVRSDIRHRVRWLAPGKHWLTVLFGAMVGSLGWAFINHVFALWPTSSHPLH